MRKTEIPRTRGVTAVLGPTNTGKTHLAVERMLGHDTGLIGLPLRLLAREVYDKIVARIGPAHVALITGEEKIKPENPRYWVCTVEAMPRDVPVDFLAIDEIQLAGDPERGHVFTDRLLHARGSQETLLLGAQTMRDAINDILPGANHISRPRLSKLSYAGSKKLSRLPRRTAIVAFSAADVYAIAELIRRQRGGAAVVLGALSPRTRNAQVALYQSGDVDFMIATDAIGMGINLDVDHVAFAALRKFDGHNHRDLTPGELGQIAGRAGRHMNDGTFGVTGDAEPISADLIERLETHNFEPVRVLQWRNRELDFGSLSRLKDSMKESPDHVRLQRARMSDDTIALENLSVDQEIVRLASAPAAVRMLWDVCQVPDYRKISSANHAELIGQVYKFLRSSDERIPEDWFAGQVALADRTDGDIDTLANRIAHIRTWTFVANRADWLARPEHWQGVTREVEDKLSDALHECLTQRFVDRRTSVLMRKLNDKDELFGEIADDGAIQVEKHYVGRLVGFRFFPDAASTEGINVKAARSAASQVVSKELEMRARRVASAKPDAFKLTRKGAIEWRGEEIARLERSEDPLKPQVKLIADEHLTGPDQERVQKRLDEWMQAQIEERLKPLVAIARAEDVAGLARGIAFRMTENFGILKRESVAEEIRSLDQAARGQLRKYGVRFGAFNVYFPLLLKPAASELILVLWALKSGAEHGIALDAMPEPPRPGLTSVPAVATIPEAYYRAGGFHVCGPRAVRLDMLERLADLIRPLTAYRARETNATPPPKGSSGNGGFTIIPEMMSIMGCSAEELGAVLKSLGFWSERRRKPVPVVAAAPSAAGVVAGTAAADGSVLPADTTEAVEVAASAGVSADMPADMLPHQFDEQADTPVPAAADPTTDASQPEAATAAADASPEAVATIAEAAAPADVASAEPEYEDIWRPRRRYGDDNRDPRAADRERPARKPPWKSNRPPVNRDGTVPDAVAADAAAGGAAAASATPVQGEPGQAPERRGWQRRDRPAGAREGAAAGDRDGKSASAGRPARTEQNRSGPNRSNRGPNKGPNKGYDRDNDRRRDQDRTPYKTSAEPKRKEADPDSPFAALSQLKAALEKRTGGDPTS